MGTRTPTPNSSAPHAPRSRNWARTRLADRRHPAAGPGVRRSDSRGSAIRKILRPSPALRDGGAPLGAFHQQQAPGAYCRRSPPLQVPAVRPESRQVAVGSCCSPCLGWFRPFRGANPGSQLIAVVTEVPGSGSGVADVRVCWIEGNEHETHEGSRFRCFGVLWLACWRGRSRRVAGDARRPRAWDGTGTGVS